jgi:hypothetical protein
MIDDMLTPCEDCDGIGGVRCMVCGRTYCDDHIDDHECVEED